MEKVTRFLEQYVQWLALALGGAYVLWAGYAYLLNQPLTAKVGSPAVAVAPGDVDPKIRETTARRLEEAIKNPEIDKPRVANVGKIVLNGIDETDTVAVASNAFGGGSAHAPFRVDSVQAAPSEAPIAELPKPPPAVPDKQTARMTVIMVPSQGKPAAPVPPAAGGAAPDAGAAPAMVRQDKFYWSGTFKVDMAALSKEITRCFSRPNVPPDLLVAEFVRVELLREEKKADGSWSAPAVIKSLPIYDIMPHPAERKPPLTGDALKQALYEYQTWLEQNQDIIVHPAFYQTAPDAEIWVAPGEAPPEVVAQPGQAVAERPFDPSRDNPKTPDQIRQKQAYQEALRQQRLQSRRGAGGAGGRLGGPGAFVPPNVFTPRNATPPGMEGPVNPYVRPPVPAPHGGGVPAPFVNPNMGNQPNGNNDLLGQDKEILVHDVTIEEGRTYRYAVRYKLFNPMFDKAQLATREVAAKFDIDSPDPSNPKTLASLDPKADPAKLAEMAEKLWTTPVTVEPLAHIYVTQINAFNNPTADFVIYTWKDGHWGQSNVKKLTPGDAVTANKAPTPWTVVDVRKDPHNEAYVILMDDHGVLVRRDVTSDSQDGLRQKLQAAAGGGAAAALQ